MRSLIVSENESGQRLDKLLAKYLNLAGKGFLYKMMRKKNITLNGKKCDGSEKLVQGDEVKLFFSEETIEKFSSHTLQEVKKVNLHIIYEDDHILLVNKPSGMLSQKAKDTDESLVEYIIDYLISTVIHRTAPELPPIRLQPPGQKHQRPRRRRQVSAGPSDYVRGLQRQKPA